MGYSSREDSIAADLTAAVVASGVLLGLAALAAAQERRRAEEQEREELALSLVEILLNREAGNILGDSTLAFRFQNTVEPTDGGSGGAGTDD